METKTIQIPEGWIIDKEKSTDTNIVLKEAKRWRDNPCNKISGYVIDVQCNVRPVVSTYFNTKSNYNIFATEKQVKSALAMARISQIIANDERFGGVVTDEEWNNVRLFKYVIYRVCSHIETDDCTMIYKFLAFHTEEQRDLFLDENEDLVKEYLMIES